MSLQAYSELLFHVVRDAVDHPAAAGDAKLATPDVIHPSRVCSFGATIRDDLELHHFTFCVREPGRKRLDVGQDLRAGDFPDAAVLRHDVEHQRHGPFAPEVVLAA